MILIPAGIAIGVVIGWLFTRNNDGLYSVMVRLFLAFAGCVSGVVAQTTLSATLPANDHETFQMVNVHESASVSGSFFLGSGSVQGETGYIYYSKSADGSYAQKFAPGDESKVFEESRADGQVDVWSRNYWWLEEKTVLEYDFHIPVGSIDRTFNLGK